MWHGEHSGLQVKLVACTQQARTLLSGNQLMQDSKYMNQAPKRDWRHYDYSSDYPTLGPSDGLTQHPCYQRAVHTEHLQNSIQMGCTIQELCQSLLSPTMSESPHRCRPVESLHAAFLSYCLQSLALLVVVLQDKLIRINKRKNNTHRTRNLKSAYLCLSLSLYLNNTFKNLKNKVSSNFFQA